MDTRLQRAFGVGVLILASGYAIWAACLYAEVATEAMTVVFWCVPVLAGFVAAWIARRSWLLLGLGLAVSAAVFAVLLNFYYQVRGLAVDFPGIGGGIIVGTLAAVWSAIAATTGAAAANFIRRRQHDV
jgi:hypothetical protein